MQKVTPAREAALNILVDIEKDKSYVNLILKNKLANSHLSSKDKGLVTELVYGVIQRLNTLDWYLDNLASKKMIKTPIHIKNILRMGAYQILYLDKIPVSAAVDEAVKLVKKYAHSRSSGFVNGILRNISRKKEELNNKIKLLNTPERLSLEYSQPKWLVKRWLENYSLSQVEKICKANNDLPFSTIRVNTLKIFRDKVIDVLNNKSIECSASPILEEAIRLKSYAEVSSLAEFEKGFITIQGESSILSGLLLDPQPGETVVDLCCAPGGKTSHIAQLMNNEGEIIAGDINETRVKLAERHNIRMDVDIARFEVWDGRDVGNYINKEVDRVLVDSPCSGLGVIKRKPDLKWRVKEEDIHELAKIQLSLLLSAAKILKHGGTLLYCVCTNEPEETVQLVDSFLKENEDFKIDKTISLPDELDRFVENKSKGIQLLPNMSNSDGFFYVRFKRNML